MAVPETPVTVRVSGSDLVGESQTGSICSPASVLPYNNLNDETDFRTEPIKVEPMTTVDEESLVPGPFFLPDLFNGDCFWDPEFSSDHLFLDEIEPLPNKDLISDKNSSLSLIGNFSSILWDVDGLWDVDETQASGDF